MLKRVFSSWNQASNLLASAVGFDGFIVKPYEKQDLIDKIRSLIEKQ